MFSRFKYFISSSRLNLLLKFALVAGLCGLLWYALRSKEHLDEVWQAFVLQFRQADVGWLLATLLLMPMNWLIETQKWYPLVRLYEPISHRTALKAVLAGTTLSIFSPNRLGEYGGRVLFVNPSNRWKALIAHLVGGFGQFVILIVFGLAGASWSLKNLWHFEPRLLFWCLSTGAAVSVVLLLIYFNFKFAVSLARQIAWLRPLKRYVKDVAVLEYFTRAELRQILGWSALRYFFSCCQYFFLLQFFGIKTGLLEGFSCIASIFLIQTCIPLPPVANFFARSNTAIWIWSTFGANEFSSLATTFLLWIINLFLPALLGTFSILHVNISKSLGYENE